MEHIQTLRFYQRAILETAPDIRRIDIPVVRGTNSRIFLVETFDGARTVFRFNQRQIAHRNHDVSQVLLSHGISVPAIRLHLFQGQYFESYPYIPGLTFQECLNAGMSKAEILDTYATMAAQVHKISQIPVQYFENIENKNCSNVAQLNIVSKTGRPSLGQFVKYGTKLLNAGEQHICHCDFAPQNIVLGDNKQASVLDLNAVSISNINFALAITGLALRKNKLDPCEFYDICSDIIPGQIQPKRINLTEQICAVYYRSYCK